MSVIPSPCPGINLRLMSVMCSTVGPEPGEGGGRVNVVNS